MDLKELSRCKVDIPDDDKRPDIDYLIAGSLQRIADSLEVMEKAWKQEEIVEEVDKAPKIEWKKCSDVRPPLNTEVLFKGEIISDIFKRDYIFSGKLVFVENEIGTDYGYLDSFGRPVPYAYLTPTYWASLDSFL